MNQDITYTNGLVVEDNVRIILADGKTMHMDVEGPFAIIHDNFYQYLVDPDANESQEMQQPSTLYICGQEEATGTLSIEATGEFGILTMMTFMTCCNLEISGEMGCAVLGFVLDVKRANVEIHNEGLPQDYESSVPETDDTFFETGMAIFGEYIISLESNISIQSVNGIGAEGMEVRNVEIEGGNVTVTATETAITAEGLGIGWTEMTDSFRFSSLDVEGFRVHEEQSLMTGGKIYLGTYEDEELTFLDELSGKTLKPYWPFTDVKVKPGDWKYEGVKFVYEHGIMTGDADSDNDGFTTFNPKGNITRGEFITTLYRLDGEKEVEGNEEEFPFTDVKKNKFYYMPVFWALTNEITTGTSATTFSPKDNITRQDMATLLMRFADYMGFDTSGRADIRSMPDYSRVKTYARDAMAWANYEGIITGKDIDGKKYLDPRANATRQETATILQRFMERYMSEE